MLKHHIKYLYCLVDNFSSSHATIKLIFLFSMFENLSTPIFMKFQDIWIIIWINLVIVPQFQQVLVCACEHEVDFQFLNKKIHISWNFRLKNYFVDWEIKKNNIHVFFPEKYTRFFPSKYTRFFSDTEKSRSRRKYTEKSFIGNRFSEVS